MIMIPTPTKFFTTFFGGVNMTYYDRVVKAFWEFREAKNVKCGFHLWRHYRDLVTIDTFKILPEWVVRKAMYWHHARLIAVHELSVSRYSIIQTVTFSYWNLVSVSTCARYNAIAEYGDLPVRFAYRKGRGFVIFDGETYLFNRDVTVNVKTKEVKGLRSSEIVLDYDKKSIYSLFRFKNMRRIGRGVYTNDVETIIKTKNKLIVINDREKTIRYYRYDPSIGMYVLQAQ